MLVAFSLKYLVNLHIGYLRLCRWFYPASGKPPNLVLEGPLDLLELGRRIAHDTAGVAYVSQFLGHI